MTTTLPSERETQTAAVPAAHVKFTGMSGSALSDPAQLGDHQTFVVTAVCVGSGKELRKDGEVREVRKMEVVDVEFGEITPAPRDGQLALDEDDTPLGDQP